jgi:ParB-like chromosome segregation protein Spo0J
LIPYARNARTHSDEQVAQIAASIKEWGWTTPILVDEGGQIIAGHGRVSAARTLGVKDAPVMVATGWTEAQKRAYVLADNKLALNAGWDNELLALERTCKRWTLTSALSASVRTKSMRCLPQRGRRV